MSDDDDNDTLPPPKVTDAPAAIWLVYGEIERDATHWEGFRSPDSMRAAAHQTCIVPTQ